MQYVKIADMVGKTFDSVTGCRARSEEVTFKCAEGVFRFFHEDECCEDVRIEDVAGDVEDLVGSPILLAEERINSLDNDPDSSTTWTFYEFATAKGRVTVRWLGESNGYYSESVDLEFLPRKE